ncbi:MAG: hypothetical protein V4683_16420 [Bacteroidota bacterium]
MNSTFKTLAIALGLSIANSVQAQEPNVTLIDNPGYIAKVITVPNTNSMKVYVGNIENQKLSFNVKDASGALLFSRNISKNEPQAYIKLSLDELPDGIYSIEMGDKNSKTVKSFKKVAAYAVTKPIGSLVAIN